MKKVVAGMDLHSNNAVIGIMDMDGKRLASWKVECDLREVVKFLAPYKKRLERIAVESTYNWYWLLERKVLQAIRPCRESKTGWTWTAWQRALGETKTLRN